MGRFFLQTIKGALFHFQVSMSWFHLLFFPFLSSFLVPFHFPPARLGSVLQGGVAATAGHAEHANMDHGCNSQSPV